MLGAEEAIDEAAAERCGRVRSDHCGATPVPWRSFLAHDKQLQRAAAEALHMSVVPTTILEFYRALLELTRAPTFELLDSVLGSCGELLGAQSVRLELTLTGGNVLHRTWTRRQNVDAVSGRAELRVPIRIGAPTSVVRIEREENSSADEQAHLDLLAHHLGIMAERFDHDLVQRSVPDELEQVQRRRTFAALRRHYGNVAATARELGVSRTSVYRIAQPRRRQ